MSGRSIFDLGSSDREPKLLTRFSVTEPSINRLNTNEQRGERDMSDEVRERERERKDASARWRQDAISSAYWMEEKKRLETGWKREREEEERK